MKRILFLGLLSMIFITACDKNENAASYDLTGNWKVISFEDYENSTKVTKTDENTWPQFNNGDNTLNFTPSNATIGIVSGIGVTNSFTSNYTIDKKGKFSLNGGGIFTMMGEPEWGTLFRSISEVESYEIRNGYLILFYNKKKNSMTLERV